MACRRCLRPPLLSIPLVAGLGREAASPHQGPHTLAPLRRGFFRTAGSALRHRNQLLGSKFCRGLPPNSGARLLVIDPLLVRSDVRRQAPLRRLSPATWGAFFLRRAEPRTLCGRAYSKSGSRFVSRVVLPRGNVRRDFIDRCESPLRCATDYGIVSVGLPLHRQAPLQGAPFSPVPLAGLLFGRPCPLRWLPVDARRMPLVITAGGASGASHGRARLSSRKAVCRHLLLQ